MSLPDVASPHIRKPQAPIGAVRNDKIKTVDGETGRIVWKQGKKGMARDWDGDPTSKQYNKDGLKKKPRHKVRMGYKRAKHKPHLGERRRSN